MSSIVETKNVASLSGVSWAAGWTNSVQVGDVIVVAVLRTYSASPTQSSCSISGGTAACSGGFSVPAGGFAQNFYSNTTGLTFLFGVVTTPGTIGNIVVNSDSSTFTNIIAWIARGLSGVFDVDAINNTNATAATVSLTTTTTDTIFAIYFNPAIASNYSSMVGITSLDANDGTVVYAAGSVNGVAAGTASYGFNLTTNSYNAAMLAVAMKEAAAGSNIATIDGLAKASVGTMNGLAIGSVSGVDGLP